MDDKSHAAFEEALRTGAYEAAWRYCCRLTTSREDAQDLLQDSIGVALLKFQALRQAASFRSWLMAIIRRRFLQNLRSRKTTLPLEEELVASLVSEPDMELDMVRQGLRSLPLYQREILELFYIEGLSLAELSIVLGTNSIAARHRLHRSREALRRAVNSVTTIAASQPVKEPTK